MDFFGINGWELVALVLLAVVILGPERLPDYAAKLARAVQKLRDMSNSAKAQIKDELGPEFEDVNWRQYDPRQYDPRRIVREALLEPPSTPSTHLPAAGPSAAAVSDAAPDFDGFDPERATPFDVDAT